MFWNCLRWQPLYVTETILWQLTFLRLHKFEIWCEVKCYPQIMWSKSLARKRLKQVQGRWYLSTLPLWFINLVIIRWLHPLHEKPRFRLTFGKNQNWVRIQTQNNPSRCCSVKRPIFRWNHLKVLIRKSMLYLIMVWRYPTIRIKATMFKISYHRSNRRTKSDFFFEKTWNILNLIRN